MNETSGVLRPAVLAYLNHEAMTPEHIATMRAYLRLWANAPGFIDIEHLRAGVDGLTSRAAIRRWLNEALEAGIDPL